jgi:hypothetical protein
VGLKDKNYFILNKQYSKEEYKIKIDEYLKETISFKEKFNVLKQSTPRKYIF